MNTLIIDNNTGRVQGINKEKLNEIPFFLMPNQPDNRITLAALSGGTRAYAMTAAGEGPLKVFGLSHYTPTPTAGYAVKISLQEGESSRAICNTAVHLATIAGSGALPYPMPEPLYTDELRKFIIEPTNLHTSQDTIDIVAHCSRAMNEKVDPTLKIARARQDYKQFLSIPFFYTFDDGPVTLTGLGTSQQTITINEDAHFMFTQLSYFSTGRFSLDIIDNAKGESIISAPQAQHYELPNDLILGNGQYPYCFSEGILVQLGQKLIINLTDLSGSSNKVWLTLGGRAIADRLWR